MPNEKILLVDMMKSTMASCSSGGLCKSHSSVPIRAHIQMVVKWGKPRQIPGIGVQFKDLSTMQAAELAKFFRPVY